MEFEFDPQKSKKNKTKHGVDFVAAQRLWDDSDGIGFPAPSEDEQRYSLLGMMGGKLWVAFYTLREGRIRLISVLRARKGERKLYES